MADDRDGIAATGDGAEDALDGRAGSEGVEGLEVRRPTLEDVYLSLTADEEEA